MFECVSIPEIKEQDDSGGWGEWHLLNSCCVPRNVQDIYAIISYNPTRNLCEQKSHPNFTDKKTKPRRIYVTYPRTHLASFRAKFSRACPTAEIILPCNTIACFFCKVLPHVRGPYMSSNRWPFIAFVYEVLLVLDTYHLHIHTEGIERS